MDNQDSLPASAAEEAEHSSVPALREKPKLVAQQEVMAIMPTTIEEAGRYATGLVRAGIVPDAFREGGRKENPANPELVMMGVLKSMEMSAPPDLMRRSTASWTFSAGCRLPMTTWRYWWRREPMPSCRKPAREYLERQCLEHVARTHSIGGGIRPLSERRPEPRNRLVRPRATTRTKH
jgi:hypothetical protein